MTRFIHILNALVFCLGIGAARSDAAPKRPQVPAGIERVLIISIDGLRPDLLLRGNMPHVRQLCADGAYTFWAETTPEAYTLPCHVSMLTGAHAKDHGVTWNYYIEESYSNVPTLFEIAKDAGYSTAMASGKMKFIVFARPGSLDHCYLPLDEPVSDDEVASRAEGFIRKHRPNITFVHLPGVDTVGHDFGWGSLEQMAQIERADAAVGRIIKAVSELKLSDSTLVMLTADHGGAAKAHKMNDTRSRIIPWIIRGPGIRRGFDLTLFDERTVHVEDTFATACAFLKVDPGSNSSGTPVLEALETFDLPQDGGADDEQ